MNVAEILTLIQLLTTVAQTAATGTKAEGAVETAEALETVFLSVAKMYQQESGQPIDLSKLTPEDPIV